MQNTWDLSCSEHLQPKETYQNAAQRGLREELGILLQVDASPSPAEAAASASPQSPQLELVVPDFLQRFKYDSAGVTDSEFVQCWRLKNYDGPINIDNVEVCEIQWRKMDDVWQEIQEKPELFAPWLVDSLTRCRKA